MHKNSPVGGRFLVWPARLINVLPTPDVIGWVHLGDPNPRHFGA